MEATAATAAAENDDDDEQREHRLALMWYCHWKTPADRRRHCFDTEKQEYCLVLARFDMVPRADSLQLALFLKFARNLF